MTLVRTWTRVRDEGRDEREGKAGVIMKAHSSLKGGTRGKARQG